MPLELGLDAEKMKPYTVVMDWRVEWGEEEADDLRREAEVDESQLFRVQAPSWEDACDAATDEAKALFGEAVADYLNIVVTLVGHSYAESELEAAKTLAKIPRPVTHAGESPESLVDRLVLVRPHYQVPTGRGSRGPARSPWVRPAYVDRVASDGTRVWVTIHHDSAGPWPMEQLFHPRELHQVSVCECAACAGDGIHELKGA